MWRAETASARGWGGQPVRRAASFALRAKSGWRDKPTCGYAVCAEVAFAAETGVLGDGCDLACAR